MTTLSDLTTRLAAAQEIGPEDVLALRRLVWPDGVISANEAEAMFALNDATLAPSVEWTDLFVEAVSDYVVRQQQPEGYIDEAKADWLIARLTRDGRVETMAELEALVRVIEKAVNAPERLKAFALDQVERIVATGEGATRRGGTVEPGRITAGEAALLRRLVFAQAGDGPAIVSRAEADALFRLKDAAKGAANAPEWKTLFVQAVANHLMAHASYVPLAREDAARLDAFMNDTRSSTLGFIGRMFRSKPHDAFPESQPGLDHDAAVAADLAITSGERSWLDARVAADSDTDELEQALLDFLAEETAVR